MSGAAAAHAMNPVRCGALVPKLKALVWEEARVGGVIAGFCTILAVFYQVYATLLLGTRAWELNDALLRHAVMGIPLLIALLLTLNPNNTGHLIGGFPMRVLWLPVPATAAALVPLITRASFVFASSFIILGTTRYLFAGGPALATAILFVTFYLVVQTVNWLRGVVSGLSSLLIAAAMAGFILIAGRVHTVMSYVPQLEVLDWTPALVVLAVAGGIAGVISVVSVQATRAGRSTGFPEVWEWHELVAVKGPDRLRPFSSPVAAQIWFELRRNGWVLPGGTLVFSALLIIPWWLYADVGRDMGLLIFESVLVFLALFLAALAHGARANVIGLRVGRGRPGYSYQRPLVVSDYALAQTMANLIVLVPTVMIVAMVHYVLIGGVVIREVLPEALGSGMISLREAIWIVASRGILAGLVAWFFMAVGSRLVGAILFLGLVGLMVSVMAAYVMDSGFMQSPIVRVFEGPLTGWVIPGALLIVTAGALCVAWRKGWIPGRALLAWIGAWLLTGWLLRAALPQPWPEWLATPAGYAVGALACLAWAAAVPFPYVAILLDVTRRRHGSWASQDGRDRIGEARPGPGLLRRRTGWIGAVAAVFILWLGWPGQPSYVAYLEERGEPARLEDLNEFYREVPDDLNVALDYLAVAEELQRRDTAFHGEDYDRWSVVYLAGGGSIPLTGPLPEDVWANTQAYRETVTSHVTPELIRLAEAGPGPSRYPVDLREGFSVLLEHLAKLRSLTRALTIETLCLSVVGDTDGALDAMGAILPLSASMAEEPLLISQLVRLAILRYLPTSAEIVLNRAVLDDGSLERLEEQLTEALAHLQEAKAIDVGLRGERVLNLSHSPLDWAATGWRDDDDRRRRVQPSWIPSGLVIGTAANRMTILYLHELLRNRAAEPVPGLRAERNRYEQIVDDSVSVATLAAVVMGALERTHAAEWEAGMRIAMARAAVAAERFRRAEGRLPDGLEELVPAYLDAVPRDVYLPALGPVRYARRAEGGFVIYSVGRSGVDHGGMARSVDERSVDDIVFTVALEE